MLSTRVNKNLSLSILSVDWFLNANLSLYTALSIIYFTNCAASVLLLCCLSSLCCASGTYKSNYFAIGFLKYRPRFDTSAALINNQKPRAKPEEEYSNVTFVSSNSLACVVQSTQVGNLFFLHFNNHYFAYISLVKMFT